MTENDPSRPVEIATFYRFVDLPDADKVAARLHELAGAHGLLGTVIVATEGINGTVAGESCVLRRWIDAVREDPRFGALRPRYSTAPEMPFYRLKIKRRDEIVTLGKAGVKPQQQTGTHVAPEHWDQLLADPEVILIDTRNRYEVGVGSFAGAINPETDSFREFPQFVKDKLRPDRHRKVAMFCTGGIRCEKASAWMLGQGFEKVYQLDGGILAYLESKTAESGQWRGSCFLFDQRVGVGYGLERSELRLCYGCRHPLSDAQIASHEYEEGVSCPLCAGSLTESRRAALRERHRQEMLARKRGRRHIGNRQQN